jgi:hypothetical protein
VLWRADVVGAVVPAVDNRAVVIASPPVDHRAKRSSLRATWVDLATGKASAPVMAECPKSDNGVVTEAISDGERIYVVVSPRSARQGGAAQVVCLVPDK